MRKPVDLIAESRSATVDRRQALRFGLAGLGAAAGILALTRPSHAFTLQEADAPTTAAFHNACGNVSYHQKLADEVRTLLTAKNLPPADQPQTVVCPICGCKVPV